MFNRITVIGSSGRVGAALGARLLDRGLDLTSDDPELVLLCVPDRTIADVAATLPVGPWVAHVSGATSLAALAPHGRRFTLHPLQTFTHTRGPEQLDGAWCAVAGETEEALTAARGLAELLGLAPFELADDRRALYHAGATMAGPFIVALRKAGGALLEAAGAPPAALDPLMRRVIENDFALTGPVDRGDWETVDRHLAVIREHLPELAEAYSALTDLTAAQAGGTRGAVA